jgi:hypothetical protein
MQEDIGNMFHQQDERLRSYFSKLFADIVIDM